MDMEHAIRELMQAGFTYQEAVDELYAEAEDIRETENELMHWLHGGI